MFSRNNGDLGRHVNEGGGELTMVTKAETGGTYLGKHVY